MIPLGVMQLPGVEDPDDIQTYLNGQDVSGGLWTALTRSSNHDHTGGLNGTLLSIAAIPDGSITTGKLDPSVLGPYALVDGSKPFTGQVTMNADAIIRDTLFFGAKPAGVGDATFKRTGAGALRVDTHLGVGVNPEAFQAGWSVLRLGQGASLRTTDGPYVDLTANTYIPAAGGNGTAQATGAASYLRQNAGTFVFFTAPSVAAGAEQTFTQRMSLSESGSLAFATAAANYSIQANRTIAIGQSGEQPGVQFISNTGVYQWLIAQVGTSLSLFDQTSGTAYEISSPNRNHKFHTNGGNTLSIIISGLSIAGECSPATHDSLWVGYMDGRRWYAVSASLGTIQTSHASMKEGIAPLDPTACAQAVLDTDWVEFDYRPPAYAEPEFPEGETPEARETGLSESKALHLKRVAESEVVRHQKGYVLGAELQKTSNLFGLADGQSTSVSSDLAVVACALQGALQRIAALEAAA